MNDKYEIEGCIQNVYKLDTQVRLGKVRLEKDNICPFNLFWNEYPNKENKKKAQQIWKSKNLDTSLQEIIEYATGGLIPDLTLLLDLPPEVGLKRRLADGGLNRLDAYDLEFHKRVRAGYHKLVEQDPNRWVIIDADQGFDQVQKQSRDILIKNFTGWGY